MKRTFTIISFFALCISVNIDAQNLLLNGNFEQGKDLQEDWRPVAWPQWQNAPGALWCGVVIDSAEEVYAYEGNMCWRMQPHTAGTEGDISQEIASPDEGQYKLSLFAKIFGAPSFKFHVELINIPEETSGHWSYFVNQEVNISEGEWQNTTIDLNYADSVVAGTLKLRIVVIVDENVLDSKLFLDSISLAVAPPVTAINPIIQESGIKIYPNPVTSVLKISNINRNIQNIAIFDLSGKKVMSFNEITSQGINVSPLEKGLYIVSLKTASGTYSEKFLKQ